MEEELVTKFYDFKVDCKMFRLFFVVVVDMSYSMGDMFFGTESL
jgi:hypothetical protein